LASKPHGGIVYYGKKESKYFLAQDLDGPVRTGGNALKRACVYWSGLLGVA